MYIDDTFYPLFIGAYAMNIISTGEIVGVVAYILLLGSVLFMGGKV